MCPVWDVEAKSIQVLRGWYRCEQQLVCRSPGKLGRGSSFAVPEESQQAPPEVLSLIHLHLYFSWCGSSDEQSWVLQGAHIGSLQCQPGFQGPSRADSLPVVSGLPHSALCDALSSIQTWQSAAGQELAGGKGCSGQLGEPQVSEETQLDERGSQQLPLLLLLLFPGAAGCPPFF